MRPIGAALAGDTVEMTYREAVNAALTDGMASDPRIYLLGEDVANDGGVFKTNVGLPEAFPGRVTNTTICGNTFMGMVLGMSIIGLRPAIEVMFSDSLATAGLTDDLLIPYSPSLEDAIIPSDSAIVDAVRSLA